MLDIQRGIVTIPKSVHSERIDANIDVFDFQLSEDDMKKINALDSGRFIAGLLSRVENCILPQTSSHTHILTLSRDLCRRIRPDSS